MRRTVRARQHADFAGDLAQIVVAAAVDALLLVENVAAERFLLDVIERLVDRELVGLREFLRAPPSSLRRASALTALLARDFAFGVERGFDAIARHAVGDFENLADSLRISGISRFGLPTCAASSFWTRIISLRVILREFERLDEFILRQFRWPRLRS